jgi:hypothetical protein
MPTSLVRATPRITAALLSLSIALAAGCGETTPPKAPLTSPEQAAWDACLGPAPKPDRGWSFQGPDLVGTRVVGSDDRRAFVRTFNLDGMVTAAGAPIQHVRVVQGRLTGEVASPSGPLEVAGASWKDVRLHAVLECADGATRRPLEARITAAYPDRKRPEGDTWLYRLEILDAASRWVPACEPDGEGETGAIPFEGVWDAHGDHHARPGAFSFGCAEAAAASCSRWGYRPWEAADAGRPEIARDLHSACTRMARADYCGDGRSATRKGTEVNHWASESRVARGASRPGVTFEAAWTPRGAACMAHARWPERTKPCAERRGPGLNEYNVPVCRSPAEAEPFAGPGKGLLFDESSVHEEP